MTRQINYRPFDKDVAVELLESIGNPRNKKMVGKALKQAHRKIKRAAKAGHESVKVEFKYTWIKEEVAKKLREEGFSCRNVYYSVHTTVLIVSWGE